MLTNVDCETPDIFAESEVLTVKLGRNLSGQIIEGPKLNRTPVGQEVWRQLQGDSANLNASQTAPRLTGLRAVYAVRIARAIGATAELTGSRDSAVLSQTPDGGADMRPDTDRIELASR